MQELFSPLSPDARQILARLPEALQAVLPLTGAHRKQLPAAIEELSQRLTTDRGLGALPYWSAPRLTSAYLWYFLPWNILRLTRLLAGLDLPAPTPLPLREGEEPLPRILADMGSGPLSLPLALWLAKPRWRALPLTLLCLDASPHPLELGQKLLQQVAGPDSPWRVVTARASVDALGRELSRVRGVPWLISGANVLNELKVRPRSQEMGVGERLEALVEQWSGILHAVPTGDARALLVEPGTRLGGKTMLTLREAALELNLAPSAPCPHVGECPLQDSRTWCHFTFDVEGAPAWLRELSEAAHLRKDALSLSFMLLRPQKDEESPASTPMRSVQGRIVSAPFAVPGVAGSARYACTEQGLALLPRAGGLPSGALVALAPAQEGRKDAKSGARIVEHRESAPDCLPPRQGRSAPRVPQQAEAPRGMGRKEGEGKREEKTAPRPPKKDKKPVKSKKQPSPKFWEK